MKSSPVEVERLFLALMPDEAMQQKLASLVKALSFDKACRKIPIPNIHLTLVFIGNFSVGRRDNLVEALSTIRVAPFELVYDKLTHRKRQQMLWLESSVPDELVSLVDQLKQLVNGFDIPVEDRQFRSHMTLARKLKTFRNTNYEVDPIHWRVNEFMLVRSKTYPSGAEYSVMEHFALCA